MSSSTDDKQTKAISPAKKKLKLTIWAVVGLLDFVLCVYLVSLFFQGTMPGKQSLRDAFREIYTFLMDPDHLIITMLVGIRLSIYGVGKWMSFHKINNGSS